jgi:hypothetical protein
MHMDIPNVLSELQAERNRLDRVITALEGLSSDSAPRRGRPPKQSSPTAPHKKTMSVAARAKISAAQKARWAKRRKSQNALAATRSSATKNAAAKQVRAKSGITPAGRKRLSAMMKARWAEWNKKAKAA